MRRRTNPADRVPTTTSLVENAIKQRDDFMNMEQLRGATQRSTNQVSAALHHLKKRKVLDSIEAEGSLWWFLRGEDDRQFTTEARTPEPRGNRTRGLKKQRSA